MLVSKTRTQNQSEFPRKYLTSRTGKHFACLRAIKPLYQHPNVYSETDGCNEAGKMSWGTRGRLGRDRGGEAGGDEGEEDMVRQRRRK
ncbi:hypothetical protein Pcinc_038895 [Petrolisthes cinctipes]|uniref:Uncharacterized protein n=1 Tax=Petrolisthes cinctipes TaxID=88211 RepID=A0AAE1EJV1_PETCI|nr:hypothetical protein Pcinc_038895 [Petrolisthes cinctipes]